MKSFTNEFASNWKKKKVDNINMYMSNIFSIAVYGNFPFLIFICISAASRETILDPQGYLKLKNLATVLWPR